VTADVDAPERGRVHAAEGDRGARSLRVLIAQLTTRPGDPEANASRVERLLRDHRAAELAVFPELFLGGYAAGPDGASALDGSALGRVRRAAAASSTAIVLGFTEPLANGELANAAACIDVDGRIVASHHKTHLFGGRERRAFTPGDTLHVVALAGWRIGVLICFEMEFPEPARALARGGAELLVTISANMAPYRADHHLASRARALDNRLPHVYVNRVGREDGLVFVGGSQVIGSDGGLRASAGGREQVLVHDLILSAAASSDTDYLRLARPELSVVAEA